VQVYRDEKNIKGSPFPVSVKDSDIAHAGKVHINGALTSAIANESNNIAIDAADAGRLKYVKTNKTTCFLHLNAMAN
jgi:hypothetical protein